MAMWPQGSDNTGKASRMHVEVVQEDVRRHRGSVGFRFRKPVPADEILFAHS
jgi:hypothetical protein